MRKATVFAVAIALSQLLPAMADDPQAKPSGDSGSMLKNAAMLPVKALGIGSGLVVGTPVAIIRRTTVRIREYTGEFADKIGGRKDFPPNFFASFLSVPCGVVVGTGEGLEYGLKNAVEHGNEKPFGLDSFSLGDKID